MIYRGKKKAKVGGDLLVMISGSRTVLHLFSVNVRKLSTGTILKSHEASIANQPLIANSAESKIHLENNFLHVYR